jgi:hypothetical protein
VTELQHVCCTPPVPFHAPANMSLSQSQGAEPKELGTLIVVVGKAVCVSVS